MRRFFARLWRLLFPPPPNPEPEGEWWLAWDDALTSPETLENWTDRLVNGPLPGRLLFPPPPNPEPEGEWWLAWDDALTSPETLENWTDRLVNGPLPGRLHLRPGYLDVERRETDQVAQSDQVTGRSRTEIGFPDGHHGGTWNCYCVSLYVAADGFPVLEPHQDVIVMQLLSRSPPDVRGYPQPTISLAIVRKDGRWLLQAWYINTDRPEAPLKWFVPFEFDRWHRVEVEVLWSTDRGAVRFVIDGEEFASHAGEPTLVGHWVNSIKIGQYAARGVATAFVRFRDFEKWINA